MRKWLEEPEMVTPKEKALVDIGKICSPSEVSSCQFDVLLIRAR